VITQQKRGRLGLWRFLFRRMLHKYHERLPEGGETKLSKINLLTRERTGNRLGS
jgi:hypothetical protein